MTGNSKLILAGLGALALTITPASLLLAAGKEKPQKIDYSFTPPAPQNQTWDEAQAKSSGCQTCHTDSDQKTMHETPAVVLGLRCLPYGDHRGIRAVADGDRCDALGWCRLQ